MTKWHESRSDGFQRYFINENGKRQEVRLYKIWDGIYQRCYNHNQKDFYNYGGRGIVLCDEWKSSTAFMSWAYANGYDDSLQIDRIDVNGIYCPENCRWVDTVTQAYNKRNTKYIEFNGELRPFGLLCKEHGIHKDTVRDRLKRGWTLEDSLTVKPGEKHDK